MGDHGWCGGRGGMGRSRADNAKGSAKEKTGPNGTAETWDHDHNSR